MKKSEYFILFMVIASIAVIAVGIYASVGSIQQTKRDQLQETAKKGESNEDSNFFSDIGESIKQLFEQEDDSKIQDNGELVDQHQSRSFTQDDVYNKFIEINSGYDDEDQLEYVLKDKESTFRIAISRWYQSNDEPFFNFMIITNDGEDVKYLAYCGTSITKENRLFERDAKRFENIEFGHDLYGTSFSKCNDSQDTVTVIVYNLDMTEQLYETTLNVRKK